MHLKIYSKEGNFVLEWICAGLGIIQGVLVAINKRSNWIFYILITALATYVVFSILKRTDDSLPLIDAFTTVSSFVATYYMMMKKLDTWAIWFINDILYIVEYFMTPDQAIVLAILNIVWTGLAVYSFINWRKIMREEQAA